MIGINNYKITNKSLRSIIKTGGKQTFPRVTESDIDR